MKKQFVDLDNFREPDQKEMMEEIVRAGHCPFCAENLKKYNQQPAIKETKHWILINNKWPYKNAKVHLLAIYKPHAEQLSDLNPEAGTELFQILAEVEKEYKIPGGGWAMRFGSTNHSAGTVNHLHAQFIQPDIEDPSYQPVRIKIGKSRNKLT